MKPFIIGFIGKAGSGKTEACKHIESMLPDVTRIGFKDALVQEIKDNFPDVLEEIINEEHKKNVLQGILDNGWDVQRLFQEKPPIMRRLMQNYGTEVRRGDEPDYWVKQWKSKVSYTGGHIVCDDVRFKNEAKAVRDMGGIIIKLVRASVDSTDTHASEKEMEKIGYDHIIEIDEDSIAHLYSEVDLICKSL